MLTEYATWHHQLSNHALVLLFFFTFYFLFIFFLLTLNVRNACLCLNARELCMHFRRTPSSSYKILDCLPRRSEWGREKNRPSVGSWVAREEVASWGSHGDQELFASILILRTHCNY